MWLFSPYWYVEGIVELLVDDIKIVSIAEINDFFDDGDGVGDGKGI
jgi:hypothetical protein